MRILVTGATGLIGSRLVATLGASHEGWAVGRRPVSPSPHPSITWLQWDLSHHALPPELPAATDVVVHLAQSEHYRDFPAQAMDVFNVNVASTARLLDWSRRAGVGQFILASSGGVGGAQRSHSYYLASKQSAEALTAGYATLFQVLVMRFFFVYGSGQKRGMLVPQLIDAVHSGGRIPLAGADGPRLNPVHVDDAVNAVVRAIELNAAGTVDVAGPEVLTVRAMADTVARLMGRDAQFDCDASATPEDVIGDISAMSRELTAPRRSFAEGVAELVPSSLRA